jgi:hypothetical protein
VNKTKRVAWHKHLKTAKRRDEKARANRTTATTTPAAATPQRPAATKR